MTLPVASRQWLQNFDNTFDGRWPAGDKTPLLVWDLAGAPSIINLTAGVPYSADWRQFLDDEDPGNTTITVVHVSGDNAVTEEWTFSSSGLGNNLENSGGQGAGVGAYLLPASPPPRPVS